MELRFNINLIEDYHSNTQIARVLTEDWIRQNMYCPRCGNSHIRQFENNRPVADFFCPFCKNEYELKSKNGRLGHKINDGAYDTMIDRITGNRNPDFLFMSYSKADFTVKDLIFVPKHFFIPSIIEKRKPLAQTARRAGWVGCNIIIDKIPEQGKISVISDGIIADSNTVMEKVNMSSRLETKDLRSRGWIMDVLNCVNSMTAQYFTLEDMYAFEQKLQIMHPDNHNIRAKIRQQLQVLRDNGFIAFLGNGKYRKTF